MKLSDVFSEDNIFFIKAANKDELFGRIAELITEANKEVETKTALLELIKKREKQSNTFAMENIAIPHVKCPKLDNFNLYLFIIENGVEYKEGEKKVRVIFMITGPNHSYNIHLLLLSRIARLIKETPLAKSILKEKNKINIKKLIENYEKEII